MASVKHSGWTVVLLAATLAACAETTDCPSGWCGTIVVASGAEADVLFPPASTIDVGISLNDLVFDRLADIGPNLNVIGDVGFTPRLAQSWSFENDSTIVFRLHPNARWHDGTPVTASDVEFSFDVYRDPSVGAAAQTRLGDIIDVQGRDAQTVVVRFRRWYPELFYDAVHHVWILPQHMLDSVPRASLRAHAFGRRPIGSGPFRFVRWQAAEFVELAGDSTYHVQRPGVPRLIWRFASGPGPAVTMLTAGEADVLTLPSPDDRARVEGTGMFDVHVLPVNVYTYVAFNLRDPRNRSRPHPLFQDVRLRRAIAAAINSPGVARALFGDDAVVAVGPLTPHYAAITEGVTGLAPDSAAAARALSDAGWDDTDGDGIRDRQGRRLSFDLHVPTSSSARLRAATIIQQQLAAFGIQLNIVDMEMTTWEARARTGQFDAVFGAAQHDPSPSSPLTDAWSTPAFEAMNYGRYSNTAVDRLVDRARGERNATTATSLWREAYQMVIDDAPAVWMYVPNINIAVHRRIAGVTLRPDLWSATMWKWSIDPAQFITRDLVGTP